MTNRRGCRASLDRLRFSQVISQNHPLHPLDVDDCWCVVWPTPRPASTPPPGPRHPTDASQPTYQPPDMQRAKAMARRQARHHQHEGTAPPPRSNKGSAWVVAALQLATLASASAARAATSRGGGVGWQQREVAGFVSLPPQAAAAATSGGGFWGVRDSNGRWLYPAS